MWIENGKYMISITTLYLKNFVHWSYAISKGPSAALEKRIRVGCPAHNCGGRCLLIAHVRDGRIIRLETDDRPDTIAAPQL